MSAFDDYKFGILMAIILDSSGLQEQAARLDTDDLIFFQNQMRDFYLDHVRDKTADIGVKLETRMKNAYDILSNELDNRPPLIGSE